jgi:hypothetical protein
VVVVSVLCICGVRSSQHGDPLLGTPVECISFWLLCVCATDFFAIGVFCQVSLLLKQHVGETVFVFWVFFFSVSPDDLWLGVDIQSNKNASASKPPK